ncbi:MAG: class I SAM-dependent methyltransferase, partial [Bdellovibrionales bacterium]|nr:class I SAM-dependent methyltransferase [Bdellovibrionales bacterium]
EEKVNLKNYTVTDINQHFLEVVKQRYPQIKTIHTINNKLPFLESTFTCCIANCVFEHVNDLSELLGEIRRVLRPQAKLLVVIPTNGGLSLTLFKWLVSYPSLYLAGIKKPSMIWNYENVNQFQRVNALLHKNFKVCRAQSVPFSFLPWFLSPLYFFECENR